MFKFANIYTIRTSITWIICFNFTEMFKVYLESCRALNKIKHK